MTRPQALMEAVSANLNWFLKPIGENLTKPQKNVFRDGLVGLLRGRRGDQGDQGVSPATAGD